MLVAGNVSGAAFACNTGAESAFAGRISFAPTSFVTISLAGWSAADDAGSGGAGSGGAGGCGRIGLMSAGLASFATWFRCGRDAGFAGVDFSACAGFVLLCLLVTRFSLLGAGACFLTSRGLVAPPRPDSLRIAAETCFATTVLVVLRGAVVRALPLLAEDAAEPFMRDNLASGCQEARTAAFVPVEPDAAPPQASHDDRR